MLFELKCCKSLRDLLPCLCWNVHSHFQSGARNLPACRKNDPGSELKLGSHG